MKFSPEFIEQVREANNIVDIISAHSQLKKTGADSFTGLCPFPDHIEKTPSFSVSETRQVYHCFGCKKSGNIYHFVQAMQSLNFPEAVEHLAERASIALPTNSSNGLTAQQSSDLSELRKKEKNAFFKANQLIKEFYHKSLLELSSDHRLRTYCQSRGLTPELIAEFEIGYASESWDDLSKYLASKKVSAGVAEGLGVIKKRKQKSQKEDRGYYDIFRERLMFPIISHTDKAVGFGGRSLDDSHPKYINSSESLVFQKGQTLYGLNKSAKYIRTKDCIVVVEGYMDFLALYSQGIKNVVATLGTALTKDHGRLLKRYSKRIVLLFDGDKAGVDAAQRSLPVLFSEGLMPKACFLPNSLDPDEFIKERGIEALRELLKSAPDLFMYIVEGLIKNFSGQPSEKVYIMNQLEPFLMAIKDERLKELYIKHVAEYLGVEPSWVKKMGASGLAQKKEVHLGQKNISQQNHQTHRGQSLDSPSLKEEGSYGATRISLEGASKAELYLLNLALQDSRYFTKLLSSDIVEKFANKGLCNLFAWADSFFQKTQEGGSKIFASLLNEVNEESRHFLNWHLEEPMSGMDSEKKEQFFADCCKKVGDVYLRKKAQAIIKEPVGVESGIAPVKKLEQFMNIQRGRWALKGAEYGKNKENGVLNGENNEEIKDNREG